MSKILDIRQKHIIITFIIGLVFLFIARDIAGIGINKYIFLAFCIVFFILADYETMFYLLCFLIPLYNGLPGTYILLVAIVLLLLKNKMKLQTNVLLLTLFFLVLELIAALWYPDFNLAEIVEYIAFFYIFFLMLYDQSGKDKIFCLDMFFIGVVVFCAIVIISGLLTAPSNWMDLFAKGWFRFGETNTGSGDTMMLRGNSNELAYYCIAGISIGLVIIKEKTGIARILIAAAICLMGLSGFLSLSRTFIVVAAFVFILFFISELRSPKSLFISIVIICAVSFEAIKYLDTFQELIGGLTTRLTDTTMNTAGGRTTLIIQQWNMFWDIPRCVLLGTGVTQYHSILKGTGSIHNMLLQIVICYGFPFACIFLYSMFKPIFMNIHGKRKLIQWIPLAGILLFAQTLQFINPYALMLPFVIAVYALT